MIAHPGIHRWLVRTAEAYEIPYQPEIFGVGINLPPH
jgi:putative aminopeptidase FrvX